MVNYKEYIRDKSKNKKLVIWGMGSYGKASYDMFYDAGIKIDFFCDSDENKAGSEYRNTVCISCKELFEAYNDYFVLIANQFAAEIFQKLLEKNFAKENICVIPTPYKINFDQKIEEMSDLELKSKIDDVYNILSDEKSKKILDKITKVWHKNNISVDEFADIAEDKQYFCKDIVKIDENTVFVDIGAYLGDSLSSFLENTDEFSFKKAYCFELNKDIYDKLEKSVGNYPENVRSRIELVNKGVSDKDKTIRYISSEGSSHVGDEGEYTGRLTTLDNFNFDCAPTIIKMDIEGSEMEALKGAENLIKTHKPDLAICIYHKLSDVWEIPEYIKSLVPEYNIYFRHHSKTLIETVCYATVKKEM